MMSYAPVAFKFIPINYLNAIICYTFLITMAMASLLFHVSHQTNNRNSTNKNGNTKMVGRQAPEHYHELFFVLSSQIGGLFS